MCNVGCFALHDCPWHLILDLKHIVCCHDLISISNSMQSSHSFLGQLALIIFLRALFFSSLIVPSAAFCNGEYGSVCFTWQSACLAFCLNSPITCSLAPSITMLLGTPSCASKSDNISCALLFLAIGYALHHVFLWA